MNNKKDKKEPITGVPQLMHLQYETKCGKIMQLAFVKYGDDLKNSKIEHYYKLLGQ